MGRAPCCDKANVKKGPWSPEEDAQLKEYIEKHGTGGNWIALPQKAGLKRCGKSCRLRWLNYLRPNIKHGEFSDDEDRIICSLFASIGSRWSVIASQLPGRTDNDIKNYWNTKLKKKMMGMNPSAHHQATLLSVLQNSTSSSSSSSATSPSSFTDSTNSSCHPPHGSFTGADQPISYLWTSFMNGHSSCASAGSFYEPQESLMGPIQNYQVKDEIFVFGGEAASCSSSNGIGSCNNNQMNHVKEAEAGYGGDHETFVQQMIAVHNNYNYQHNGMEKETQKAMVCDGGYVNGWKENQSGLWEENPPLDYGIEEIKQLISTSGCNFLFDENMTQKRAVYYY